MKEKKKKKKELNLGPQIGKKTKKKASVKKDSVMFSRRREGW